jgi:hypothetical protein
MSQPRKNLARNMQQAVRSSETSVDFYRTTRLYIPEAVLFMTAEVYNVHLRDVLRRKK